MGTIISIYSKNAFREYILPAADNTDHKLTLGRQYFDIKNDIDLEMEVLSGEWYIKASGVYKIRGLDPVQGRYKLETDSIISLSDRNGGDFKLIGREVPSLYHTFAKWYVAGLNHITIGRADDNDIIYDSLGLVSKHHAVLTRSDNGWSVSNKSRNGIYVGSQRVMNSCDLEYGSFINIFGLHIICLGDVLAVDDSQVGVEFSEAIKKCPSGEKCREYAEKARKNDRKGSDKSSRACEAPEAGTIDRAPVTIELPVIGVTRWKDIYSEYLDKKEQEIRALNESNRDAMLAMYPSSMELMTSKSTHLWDRSSPDEEFLRVRIGTGEISSVNEIQLEEGKLYLTDKKLYSRASDIIEKFMTISDVPFTVDLDGANSVCISGEDRERCFDIAENIAVQLASHVSPGNLRISAVSDDLESGFSWRGIRWLPHIWSEDMSCRYYADDKAGAAETAYKLSRILISREELTDEQIRDLPRYIVFVSDIKAIAGTILEKYMGRRRYLGFTIIYLSDEEDAAAAKGILIKESGGNGIVYRASEKDWNEYTPDDFDRNLFGGFARKLASVRNEASEGIAIIPDFVTLFDTLEIKSAGDIKIKDKWAKNRTYDHLCGVIGKGSGNMVRTLDLHERYCGPHALIAGTTGSGKSEFLQSYIVSLAAEYSPKDLQFVLIDFKGGGMANTLEGLPHIAGLITNLSGGEIRRAILAVKNEIVKRQKLLNDYGINHIDDYVKLYKSGEVSEPVPHLLIVVDEFAELKKEKPEFLKDLISVAQTGRSLGIHLVLATQRPRGNVDDDIRSNMRSAVCFRVQDKKDSMDVLDKPDAAYLTGAGRGYLEVGAGEIFEPFQAAFSGKSRMNDGKDTGRVLMLTDDGRADVVSTFEEHEETAEESQLDMIKAEIARNAEETGDRACDLWLPELKHVITPNDIAACERRSRRRGAGVAIGILDDTENRQQYPFMIDFPESGNIAIVGTPSSGKTTAVRTLLDQIARAQANQKNDGQNGSVAVYGIDLDSGMMGEFEDCPFVRDIVTGQDVFGIESIFDDLGEMTENRKAAPEKDNMNSPVVVFIDSYEDFRNTAGYKYETKLTELMREGPGVGISYVMTGGGFGLGQISGSAERNIKTVLSLQQRNRYEYMDTLHTSGIDMIPEEDIKGRGLTVIHGRVLEFQIALTR